MNREMLNPSIKKQISRINRLVSFIILAFFISLLPSCTGPRTEEDLAEAVMQAFMDDDQRAFKQLYVKQIDIEEVINDSSIPDDMKKNAKQDLRAKSAFFKIISKLAFRSTRYRAYENGVNWQDVEIVKVSDTQTSYSFFNFDSEFMSRHGIEVKDIDIFFVSEKDTFKMHMDDCIRTKTRGWCLTEEVRISRVSH